MRAKRVGRLHPCGEVFLEDFIDKRTDGEFDIVSRLADVDTIVHVEIALTFDWYCEVVVDLVEEDVGCRRRP